MTVNQLESKTKLTGKSLGGVLSSLSRTKFRSISLIEQVGRARDGVGLRWKLQTSILDVDKAKKEVNQLLKSY